LVDMSSFPYDKEAHRKLFDDFLAMRNKLRSKIIDRNTYKRILKGFKTNWKREDAQFKFRCLRIRKFKVVDNDESETYIEGETKYGGKIRRNPVVCSEDAFDKYVLLGLGLGARMAQARGQGLTCSYFCFILFCCCKSICSLKISI